MEEKNYQRFEEEEGVGMAAEPLMPPMSESVRVGKVKHNVSTEPFQTDELGRIVLTNEKSSSSSRRRLKEREMSFGRRFPKKILKMALEINYSPLFIEDLETILTYFDERNGSSRFSKRILKMIHRQIKILKTMPEIGRLTDFPGVRILFVERFAIEYQIRDSVVLIIDIYSCQTNPDLRLFQKT